MAAKTSHKKGISSASNFFTLITSRSICQVFANFCGLILKVLNLSLEKEKLNRFLVFKFLLKREIRTFHVVAVQ